MTSVKVSENQFATNEILNNSNSCLFTIIDECTLMGQFNTCSKGKFQATGYGWNKTLVMTSGKLDIGDWCFCHVKPYDKQNAYFKITINMFEVRFSSYVHVLLLVGN